MISVAPATHSFSFIHIESVGWATFYLGNPTFVDAIWSLSHIVALPQKERPSLTLDLQAPYTPAVGRDGECVFPLMGKVVHDIGREGNTVCCQSLAHEKGRFTRSSVSKCDTSCLKDYVDDPSVFIFEETSGAIPGVKLPLSSAGVCLPEDQNRLEVS